MYLFTIECLRSTFSYGYIITFLYLDTTFKIVLVRNKIAPQLLLYNLNDSTEILKNYFVAEYVSRSLEDFEISATFYLPNYRLS